MPDRVGLENLAGFRTFVRHFESFLAVSCHLGEHSLQEFFAVFIQLLQRYGQVYWNFCNIYSMGQSTRDRMIRHRYLL